MQLEYTDVIGREDSLESMDMEELNMGHRGVVEPAALGSYSEDLGSSGPSSGELLMRPRASANNPLFGSDTGAGPLAGTGMGLRAGWRILMG